jgi:hypothetical protein
MVIERQGDTQTSTEGGKAMSHPGTLWRRPRTSGFLARLLLTFVTGAALLGIAPSAMPADDAQQAMLERVFGEAATLDPATVEKVKALPPGKRLLLDRDGDGRNDEAWFVDTAARHTQSPILVRAIDEDGDLDAHLGPDRDSDLYLADWGADGTVDVAVDYRDDDGDNDLDAMGTFYWVAKDRYLQRPALRAWWGADPGDDNLLWYNVDWTYYQRLCQYRCHFSGGKWFSAYNLTADSDHWIPLFENPFVFYDPDGDGSSEVVLRFTGLADNIESLRYSFDADAEAFGRRAYDYEFSITAFAEGSSWARGDRTHTSKLKLSHETTASAEIRGIPAGRVLRWERAEQFARRAPWAKACLTWDEMNANTEHQVDRDPHERWEGVIVHGSEDFPQIGGPPCSRLNKRNEIVEKPASPLRLYYDPTDHRLHLLGTGPTEGWIDVDYDLDGQRDARYTYLDEDQDGVFDRRQIDLDADGRPEFEWKMRGDATTLVPTEYEALSTFYTRELTAVLQASQQFIDAAKAALGDRLSEPDPVETFFLTKLPSWHPSTRLGLRMRSTPGGARYYVDLLRDRLFHGLHQRFSKHEAWKGIETAYAEGKYADAAGLVLTRLAPDARVAPAARFQGFTRRLPVSIHNPSRWPRENAPVVLKVKDVRAVAEDFHAQNCAVVAPERWIDWREVPHQLDQIDPAAGPELSFLADVPPRGKTDYYLYWSPEGNREPSFARKTGTDEAWDPGKLNIGWESNVAAYRTYDGMFDFFGKHGYRHSEKVEWMIYPVKAVNYHREQQWGIDALLVGETSGIGGLTLYSGDRCWPVQNPGGTGDVKLTKQTLFSGPIRAAVEIVAENVTPDHPNLAARLVCLIYAEHRESEIRVSITGGPKGLLVAPGLAKLRREETFLDDSLGTLGAWGFQDDAIGEIGMAVIAPPDRLRRVVELPHERRVLCEAPDGTLRYWILGDWRRGRRFPVAPTLDNWRRQVHALAGLLHDGVRVEVQSPEELP